MRITKACSTECRECHGLGYTPATAAEMVTEDFEPYLEIGTKRDIDGRPLAGSGCPRCHGTGQRT